MIDHSTPESEAAQCWRYIAGRLNEGKTPEEACDLAALRDGLK